MNISERLKNDATHIWKKIYQHPFVTELYDGTLPEKKFRFYVLHDYNYLTASIRNFSLLSAKTENDMNMRELLEIAKLEATGEFKGYKEFLKKMGISIEKAVNTEKTFIEISYESFLFSTSLIKSFAEGITAVLPCYWSYSEIAKTHRNKLKNNRNKLYQEWASFYLEKDYLKLVKKIKDIVDKIGANSPYEKLTKVFKTSSKYEYLFWDSVYRMESWPV